MRRNNLTAFIAASAVAAPAYAHGEQVLVSFYAQAIAVVAVLLSLRLIAAFRAHWVAGFFGCIAGVVVSWLTTASMPYMEHRVLITVLGVLLPAILAALCAYAARRYAAKSQRA